MTERVEVSLTLTEHQRNELADYMFMRRAVGIPAGVIDYIAVQVMRQLTKGAETNEET